MFSRWGFKCQDGPMYPKIVDSSDQSLEYSQLNFSLFWMNLFSFVLFKIEHLLLLRKSAVSEGVFQKSSKQTFFLQKYLWISDTVPTHFRIYCPSCHSPRHLIQEQKKNGKFGSKAWSLKYNSRIGRNSYRQLWF